MSVEPSPTPSPLPDQLAALMQGMTVKGRWAPLFVEPISGSGERLTTSIVALDQDRNVLVERCIRPEVLRALYGAKAKAFAEMIAVVEHDVRKAMLQGVDVPRMPLSGFTLGGFRRGIGKDLSQLIEQGRLMCASLSRSAIGQATDQSEDESQRTTDWASRVREVVLQTATDLRPYFGRAGIVPQGQVATRLDFYNGRYAAQFGVIRRENPGASIYHLKPRLWGLASISPDLAGLVREKDLIVHRPRLSVASMQLTERDRIRDFIDELVQAADRQEIFVYHTDRAVDAGNRLTTQARKLAA